MTRTTFTTRSFKSDLKVREATEQEEKVIEGYFVVFDSVTELWPGCFEEIARSAFDDTLENDIRALINHNTELVLARTKSETNVHLVLTFWMRTLSTVMTARQSGPSIRLIYMKCQS